MPIVDRLSRSLGRRDETANEQLAAEIAEREDCGAVRDLVDLLTRGSRAQRSDAIKVLYEVGERAPELIASHWRAFADTLASKHQRLVWGAMTALDYIAGVDPNSIGSILPAILRAADGNSVIARDHAVFVLARLVGAGVRRKLAYTALLRLLATCPAMQFPMYCERCVDAAAVAGVGRFVEVVTARLSMLKKDSQRRRVQKVLRRLQA